MWKLSPPISPPVRCGILLQFAVWIKRKEGVSKCIPSFFMTKPRLSQAEALLLPKDFVSLSISVRQEVVQVIVQHDV